MKYLVVFCILWELLVATLAFYAGLWIDGIGAVVIILTLVKLLHRFSYHM